MDTQKVSEIMQLLRECDVEELEFVITYSQMQLNRLYYALNGSVADPSPLRFVSPHAAVLRKPTPPPALPTAVVAKVVANTHTPTPAKEPPRWSDIVDSNSPVPTADDDDDDDILPKEAKQVEAEDVAFWSDVCGKLGCGCRYFLNEDDADGRKSNQYDLCQLFVAGFAQDQPWNLIRKDLRILLEGNARIASAYINDRRKFAFIKFHNHREAAVAQRILLEKGLNDHELHVNFVRNDS